MLREKEGETNREMRKCGEASEPLMLAGAEQTALDTAGGAEALESDYKDIWLKLTEPYLCNDKTASINQHTVIFSILGLCLKV